MTGLAMEFSATTIWMAMEMIGSILHRGGKTIFIAVFMWDAFFREKVN